MAYTAISPTIAQLRSELQTDPRNPQMGYAALRGPDAGGTAPATDWDGLEALVNDPTKEAGVVRRMVDIHELCEAIDAVAFAALSAGQRDSILFLTMCAGGHLLDPLDAVIRGYFTVFPAGATRNRLVAMQTKTGSRAELLWGDGVRIGVGDIQTALRID